MHRRDIHPKDIRHILVTDDYFIKWVEAEPVKGELTNGDKIH